MIWFTQFRATSETGQLETREVRERKRAQRVTQLLTAFPHTLLRIVFPADSLILQARFASNETVADILTLIRDVIGHADRHDPQAEYYLYVTPPKQELTPLNSKLFDLDLVPAAQVFVGLRTKSGPSLNNMRLISEELRNKISSYSQADRIAAQLREESKPELIAASTSKPLSVPATLGDRAPRVDTEDDPMEGRSTSGSRDERRFQADLSKAPKWFKMGR